MDERKVDREEMDEAAAYRLYTSFGLSPEEAARLVDRQVATRVLRKRLGRQPTEAEIATEMRRM